MSTLHPTRRRLLRAAPAVLCFLCFLVAPALATAQAVKNGSSVKRTVRRNNATYDKFKSDVDDYVDDADERRVESREDWQDYWNEDDQRRERERLQELRAGTHGKACIYGANGEVIHAPEGAICDRPPGARPADSKP